MWPPWPRCPPAEICQSWRKTRAEPGLALIAFSIDFSRLPQAAVSIKIPGIIIQIRKMMRFLCLRLGLYSQLKDGSWKSLSWGYSWVSNDLMVKIKLVLQRITSIKFSRDNIWCKINFTEVWLACLCCTYLGQILALNFQMYKGKVKKVEFIGCCKEWFEILFNIFSFWSMWRFGSRHFWQFSSFSPRTVNSTFSGFLLSLKSCFKITRLYSQSTF